MGEFCELGDLSCRRSITLVFVKFVDESIPTPAN